MSVPLGRAPTLFYELHNQVLNLSEGLKEALVFCRVPLDPAQGRNFEEAATAGINPTFLALSTGKGQPIEAKTILDA